MRTLQEVAHSLLKTYPLEMKMYAPGDQYRENDEMMVNLIAAHLQSLGVSVERELKQLADFVSEDMYNEYYGSYDSDAMDDADILKAFNF